MLVRTRLGPMEMLIYGHMSKVQTKFSDGLVMGCEKKKEVQDDSRVFGLNHWTRTVPISNTEGKFLKFRFSLYMDGQNLSHS